MSIALLAQQLADEILARPIPPSPKPIELPDTDADSLAEYEDLGFAEGQSFIIEYLDSAGKASTRRITVFAIVAGVGGIPCLLARCHERKAQRQFRVDRIQCCIDYDGEVFADVPQFLTDNFGMAIELSSRSAAELRWKQIQGQIRHDATLLAALSRSDGNVVDAETNAATAHLVKQAEAEGFMLDDAEIVAIHRYVGRLRPNEQAILRALDFLAGAGQRRIQRLLLAAAAVMDADGRRHASEVALINAIAEDLIGTSIV